MTKFAYMLSSKKVFVYCLIPLFLGSCVALNSHQTGRTLGHKNDGAYVGLNTGTLHDAPLYDFRLDHKFTILEGGYMSGVSENIDVGVRANWTGQVSGLAKLQFAGTKQSPFASAFSIELGMNPFLAVFGGNILYHGSMACPTSYHPHRMWAVSVTPRYTYIGIEGTRTGLGDASISLPGYSAALFYGHEYQISLEYSSFVANQSFTFRTKPIWSIGLNWRLHYRPEYDEEKKRKMARSPRRGIE
jgi:hypothetical protein